MPPPRCSPPIESLRPAARAIPSASFSIVARKRSTGDCLVVMKVWQPQKVQSRAQNGMWT